MGLRGLLDVVVKEKILPRKESNLGFPARNLVSTLTDFQGLFFIQVGIRLCLRSAANGPNVYSSDYM